MENRPFDTLTVLIIPIVVYISINDNIFLVSLESPNAGQYPDELHCVNVELISHSVCNAGNMYDGIVYEPEF